MSAERNSVGAISGTDPAWSEVLRFTEWLEKKGYESYDPYDFWGTSYGKFARKLYYKKSLAGTFLTAPFVLMEILFPGYRKLFVKKDRYATADAQLGLAFLNLYELSEKENNASDGTHKNGTRARSAAQWLTKAKKIADDLLKQSVPGYKGYCWGYPFDWRHVNGFMPKGTPHITATPYCYEFFAKLYDLTGEEFHLRTAESVAAFVSGDLKDTSTGEDSAASSYTPYDNTKVVNASAYRAFVLIDAAERCGNQTYRDKALKNVRFILQSQNADGSWLYAIDNPAEAFIDNFHTCFVLKNLYKLNRHLNSPEVQEAVERGYKWYRKSLFDGEGNPKSYAIAPRVEIVRLELYNVAEAISLGALLGGEFPDAVQLAEEQTAKLIGEYKVSGGHWATRIYIGGIKHTFPYLRWPQSQLFLALTNYLFAKSKRSVPLAEYARATQ